MVARYSPTSIPCNSIVKSRILNVTPLTVTNPSISVSITNEGK